MNQEQIQEAWDDTAKTYSEIKQKMGPSFDSPKFSFDEKSQVYFKVLRIRRKIKRLQQVEDAIIENAKRLIKENEKAS